jgi:hypothetical protein
MFSKREGELDISLHGKTEILIVSNNENPEEEKNNNETLKDDTIILENNTKSNDSDKEIKKNNFSILEFIIDFINKYMNCIKADVIGDENNVIVPDTNDSKDDIIDTSSSEETREPDSAQIDDFNNDIDKKYKIQSISHIMN